MEKMEYAMEIAKRVNGDVSEIEKANGVKLIGISIRGESNITPTIYIDKMYMEEMSIDEAAKLVKEINENRKIPEMDLEYLHDFEKVKPMLRARLYNNQTNAEILRKAPEPFNDLIIIPYIEGIIENGACRVTLGMVNKWNTTVGEILDIAEENSKKEYEIKRIEDVLIEMMGNLPFPEVEIPEIEHTLIVVTNKSKIYGAYSIIPAMEDLKVLFPEGFNVIPSSVHEVLVCGLLDGEALNEMINDVNSAYVSIEDQLSDHIYYIYGINK